MKSKTRSTIVERIFRDKNGKIVLWQSPNVPLMSWLFFKLIADVATSNRIQTSTSWLSTVFLFTWAYLEATQGVNYFRRALGVIVGLFLVVGVFR